jgi:putative ABC transport system substrate-binding protein
MAIRRCSAIVGVIVALVVSFGRPSVAASSAPASTPPLARVVHVCDCPAKPAQEERSDLLRHFAKLGYAEGRNLELTTYSVETLNDASGGGGPLYSLGEQFGPNPYASFFRTLVARSQPHLVLASGVRVVAAARDSQLSTPVVFWRITDPVGLGFVAALARPGGNLTGFSRAIEKLTVKRLELLHEMVPGARQVGFVYIEDFAAHVRQAAEVKVAAARIGLRVRDYSLPWTRWDEVELEALFATMRRDGIEAFLLPDINVRPTLLVELAARHRLPTIYSLTHVVTDWGGLAAYSTEASSVEDVVGYAVRILRGERPADLPVQEPTRFELVLNSRAARELGLTFPSSFLLRANHVVDK